VGVERMGRLKSSGRHNSGTAGSSIVSPEHTNRPCCAVGLTHAPYHSLSRAFSLTLTLSQRALAAATVPCATALPLIDVPSQSVRVQRGERERESSFSYSGADVTSCRVASRPRKEIGGASESADGRVGKIMEGPGREVSGRIDGRVRKLQGTSVWRRDRTKLSLQVTHTEAGVLWCRQGPATLYRRHIAVAMAMEYSPACLKLTTV
jgi:hypothetical protein